MHYLGNNNCIPLDLIYQVLKLIQEFSKNLDDRLHNPRQNI
jgi:hypothetical protein